MKYQVKNYMEPGGNVLYIGGKLKFGANGQVESLPAATGEATGGVKAAAKGAGDTVEVKIGSDGKLYVSPYTLPEASANAVGGVMLAAYQADSAATTVAGLKDDLNALLAKLRAAGLMEAEVEATE